MGIKSAAQVYKKSPNYNYEFKIDKKQSKAKKLQKGFRQKNNAMIKI